MTEPRASWHAKVKDGRHGHEEKEDDDLKDETAQDDPFAEFGVLAAFGAGHYSTTGALDDEAENVAGDEGLGQEPDGDQGVFLATDGDDDSTEVHVYRGGEENWGK